MELSVIMKLKKTSFYQGENTKHANVHIPVGCSLFRRQKYLILFYISFIIL